MSYKEKKSSLNFNPEKKKLNPDELVEKMGHCTFEFNAANKKMQEMEESYNLTRLTKHVGTILAAKRWELLENPIAQERYKKCCEEEKFKPTKDVIEDYTFLELEELMTEWSYYKMIADSSRKEYEMWQGQLFKYQSELKFQGLEMMTLGVTESTGIKKKKGA